jgi:cytochrome c553
MIQRGAGHYDLICATCHGSPAGPPGMLAETMEPEPPPMVDQMGHWRPPGRLFWTVKNGIRRSAMPAWPDQRRDDEVWSMVAFLRAMPQMSPERYDALSGRTAATMCARCHGEDGQGRDGAYPRLDIQTPAYIAATLRAFRDGSRASGTLQLIAHSLTDEAIETLAARYGNRNIAPRGDAGRGARIALDGIPERKVPACESCHGEQARADYPRLSGQEPEYLLNQLRLFATLGVERGGPYAPIMAEAVRGLSHEEMATIAAWYGR